MANKKTEIKVLTLPNGYALTVASQEYLCFTLEQLLESVFVHIGIGLTEYMNRDTIKDLMTACATWPNAKDALKSLKMLQDENERHKKSIENLKNINHRLELRIETLEAGNEQSVIGEDSVKLKKKRKRNPNVIHRDDVEIPVPMYHRRKREKKVPLNQRL
jgi:hypothetical protein